jgi:hypothetical protein
MFPLPYRGRLPFAKLNVPRLWPFATRYERACGQLAFVLELLLKSLICCFARHKLDDGCLTVGPGGKCSAETAVTRVIQRRERCLARPSLRRAWCQHLDARCATDNREPRSGKGRKPRHRSCTSRHGFDQSILVSLSSRSSAHRSHRFRADGCASAFRPASSAAYGGSCVRRSLVMLHASATVCAGCSVRRTGPQCWSEHRQNEACARSSRRKRSLH